MQAMELLKTWLAAERGRSLRLAQHLGVVPSFVNKMASGERPIPFEHGAPIEAFTGGAVPRREMFPNDWQRIWPELAATTAANDSQAQPAQQQEARHA